MTRLPRQALLGLALAAVALATAACAGDGSRRERRRPPDDHTPNVLR